MTIDPSWLSVLCVFGLIFAPRTTLAVLFFSTGNVVLGVIATVCAIGKLVAMV